MDDSPGDDDYNDNNDGDADGDVDWIVEKREVAVAN